MQKSSSANNLSSLNTGTIINISLGWLMVLVLVLGWWTISNNISDLVMPGPMMVANSLYEFFSDPILLNDIFISTSRVIGSVIVSVFLGLALAIIPIHFPVADIIVHERVKPFLNSFPSVGWAILAVIWFGSSNFSVMFVQVAILTPFCLVNIAEGFRELDKEIIEMARSFTRNGFRIFFKITLPMLKPVMIPAIVLGTVWTFNNINVIWLVSNGGEPSNQTHILVSYVYKAAFNLYRYGYAAALSMIIFLILLGFVVFFLKKTKATEGVY